MSAENFGARLKELRNAAGLTQTQLADSAGFTKGGIADLESGRRKPSWETVLAIAGALGVNCSAFQEAPASTERAKRGRPKKK